MKLQQQHDNKMQLGFTIVELMVAMVVGLMLVLGLTQLYILSKKSYSLQESLSRLQETGRFIIGTLKKEIRQADNWGCAEAITNNLKTNGNGYIDYLNQSIIGTNSTTDTLTIRRALATGDAITSAMSSTSDAVTITSSNSLLQNDIVIISDCLNGDIFQITNSTPGTTGTLEHVSTGPSQPGNASSNLFKSYGTNATVRKLRNVVFSIGTGASGENALFRNLNGTNQELVDGVEDMQILYGIDTDADYSVNRYVSANAVSTWNNVLSIRVNLLLRSEDNITGQNQSYTYNGVTTTANDNRIRQVYSATINIRNRQK